MADIVNNPGTPPSEQRVVEVRTDNGASSGWAVAVVILILVIVGVFAWMHYYRTAPAAPADNGGADINVTIPMGGSDSSGSASSDTGS